MEWSGVRYKASMNPDMRGGEGAVCDGCEEEEEEEEEDLGVGWVGLVQLLLELLKAHPLLLLHPLVVVEELRVKPCKHTILLLLLLLLLRHTHARTHATNMDE